MQSKLKYLVPILIIFSSPWFWKILNNNIFVAAFLLVITLGLFILLNVRKNKILLLTAIILSIILSLFLIKFGFDKSLFTKTTEETSILNQRRSYYPATIGSIFQNKVSLSLNSYTRNFFDNLDPNEYFFAGHPRERSGISEYEKFSPLLIPFLLIGILWGIKSGNKLLLISSMGTAVISGFIDQNFYLGPILFFPIICVLIATGINVIIVNMDKIRLLK